MGHSESDDRLTFDEAAHEYRVDGRRVPSVTQLLTGAGLIDTTWFHEDAAWRGSVVHRICQFDDEGCLKEASVDPRAAGFLAGWRAAKQQFGFRITEIEAPRFHPTLLYAGTPDRVVILSTGEPAIVDLKTGSAAKWHALQLAGYVNFFPSPRRYRRFTVRLSAEGRFVATEYFPTTYGHDWSALQGALALHNWRSIYGC